MTAVISYKGNAIATADNSTKTLLTSGTYLADDIVVTDVTSTTAVLTAKSITANGTYYAVSDSANGFSSVDVNVPGGGFEFESGIYEPTADIAKPTISFTNTHTTRPSFVAIIDVSETVASANTALMWNITNWIDWAGHGYYYSASSIYYGRISYMTKTSSSTSASGHNITSLTGTTSTCLPYYLTESAFTPWLGSSYYFRTGRAYKWSALWTPIS